MPSRNLERRLEDMLENIERIRAYVAGRTREDYLNDTMVQDAVERCFQRISEAARKIGDRFDAECPEAGFPELREFGSVLRHDYDRINPALMWSFIENRVGVLDSLVRRILAGLAGPEP